MAVLRLFAAAREAAGVARADLDGQTVSEVLDEARARYGPRFAAVVGVSRVWVNGQPAQDSTVVGGHDVVAVLPPVSGGSDGGAAGGGGAVAAAPRRGGLLTLGPRPTSDATSMAALLSRLDEATAWTGADPSPRKGRDVSPPPPQARPLRVRAPASDPAAPSPRKGRNVSLPAPPQVRPLRVRAPASDPAARPPAVSLIRPGESGSRPSPSEPPRLRASPDVPPLVGSPSAVPSSPAATAAVAVATSEQRQPATRSFRYEREPLTVVQTSDLPHGRRGVLWAAVTVVAVVAGQGWLALWLGLMAFVAATQTASVWRSRGERPMPLIAAATAAGLTVAASFGVRSVTSVAVVAVIAALCTRLFVQSRAPARDVALTLAVGVPLGLAAGSLVLLRAIGIQAPMLLLAYAAVYDAGAYLVGTGASSAWEGPAAGVAALIPLTLLASLVLVPPFRGVAPLLLGLIGAVCAPLGPLAGSALLGDRTGDRAPALRRLDSLLVMGPLWAWCAAAFLHG